MSILALDLGSKKIGIAISRSGLISEEYCTIYPKSDNLAVSEIILLLKKEKITTLVIGLPKNMDGTDSLQTKNVREFAKVIKEKISSFKLPVKLTLVDERLTSKEAERQLYNQNLNKSEIIARRDQYSAKLILDQYLDNC